MLAAFSPGFSRNFGTPFDAMLRPVLAPVRSGISLFVKEITILGLRLRHAYTLAQSRYLILIDVVMFIVGGTHVACSLARGFFAFFSFDCVLGGGFSSFFD